MAKRLPTISVLIPTLNASRVIEKCLKAISVQDYPPQKVEIIIADGGSKDKTVEIANKYGVRIYNNPLKTGEAGKAVAFKKAKNEIIALIDSDNILPFSDWFKKMVEPFADSEIIGSEPWAYTYRKKDGFVDRYCALIGMNDPLCHFLGNYDRLNTLTNKWTGLKIEQKDKKGWLSLILKPGSLPTIGANGTMMRREVLLKSGLINNYLVDIDILAFLVNQQPVKFAKVKTSIVHLYCGSSIYKFYKKQLRRIRDYMYHQKQNDRQYPWASHNRRGLLKFIFSGVIIVPLIYQSVKGYIRKPDSAWFFHPLACLMSLGLYGFGVVESIFIQREMSRKKWGQ